MVYIKEAHALDSVAPSDFGGIEDPVTEEERHEVCVRCVDDLGITIPAIVDDLDDSTNRAYGAWPDRLYLVGTDGKIAYAGGPGPRGFKPDELEKAIEAELNPPPSSLLEVLDTNGDGKLSAGEIAKASETLKKLDRNGNGELDPDELPGEKKAPETPADPRTQAAKGMVDGMDLNGDGKLTEQELPERMRPRFKSMDANGDGFVDVAEMQRVMERRGGDPRGGEQRRRRR